MKNIFNSKTGKILSYLVFWSWNLIFIIFMAAVILPTIGEGILSEIFSGEIPFDFILFLIIGTSIPIISIILGLTKFADNPKKLFQLFYGLEIPLGFILFLRLWLLKELTPGTWQLLILLIIGGSIFLYDLFSDKKHTNKVINIARFIGHSALLIIAVYFGIIMLFYFIPAVVNLTIGFFAFDWFPHFGEFITMAFIAFFFLLISGTILLILPIAMPTLYIKKFIAGVKEFNNKYSTNFTLGISASFIILNIFLFVKLNQQPQQKIFSLLEKENISQTEKAQLLKNEDDIKAGLLNSYLASYRYITTKEDKSIKRIWRDFMPDGGAEFVQNMYNAVITPFVYDGGNHREEKLKAEKFYVDFFDAPIQRAEKETVKKAIQATWDRDGIEAGLLNIDDKKVLIKEQNISFKEEDGVAEIEISELYENKTSNRQEIFYYFSLPENASITGLWLSDDETDKKYTYTVSPRGAAQQVYKNEVRRRVDPSLLEQTGPGQYRLRAFPIPAVSSWQINREGFKPSEYDNKLKLWLKYVCISKNGEYPLPTLSEKRNVFWNNKTKISINGKRIGKNKMWFPKSLKAETTFMFSEIALNEDVNIISEPLKNINSKNINENIAVFIDQTYSMKNESSAIEETINKLKTTNANIDILYYSDNILKSIPINNFKTDNLLFYGSSTYYETLKSLYSDINNEKYGNLIILTDAGSYELNKNIAKAQTWRERNDTSKVAEESERKSFDFKMPINFLHLNNIFPKSYDDDVLETIQKTNGFVAGNIEDLLNQIIAKKTYSENQQNADTYSGILWSYSENNSNIREKQNPYLKAIAAKQFIKMQIKQHDTISLNLLDKIHKVAKENSIITPYSSMIVLVNNRQKEALKKAEQAKDRFDRETETGIETMSNSNINITGTPEPEEWILIIISALMLVLMYSKYFRK